MSNTALFSILGTTYGGNGTTTFALPDLQGRSAVGQGAGPGLSQYVLGQKTGEPTHTLTSAEMPPHSHSASAFASANGPNATAPSPSKYLGKGSRGSTLANIYAPPSSPPTLMGASATQIGVAGGSMPHNNLQPFLAINYIICTAGAYPSRN